MIYQHRLVSLTNLFLSVWGLFWYTFFLQYPHRKKSRGLRSGERGAHGNVVFLEITFSPNISFRCCIVAVAVWGVAPSYWNHCLSKSIFWSCISLEKTSSTLRYRSWWIVTVLPFSWNHRGPIHDDIFLNILIELDDLYSKFCIYDTKLPIVYFIFPFSLFQNVY